MSVTLNRQDCTANLAVSGHELTAQSVVSEILCKFWSGVRASASALHGKIYFAVEVVELLQEEDSVHELLIGLSARTTDVAHLGTGSSYAFASSGQKWTAAKSEVFGRVCGVGDKIGCFLDLDSDTCTVSFAVNENWLGAAYDIARPARAQSALFPHVLLKNLKVKFDFNGKLDCSWPAEAASYQPWSVCVDSGNITSTASNISVNDCEVLVLVGLPGCGKSTWAIRYRANHADRGYSILSIDGLIKQLKIGHVKTRGKPKPPDAESQQLAEQAFEELLQHVQRVPRNYIVDDSNVYEESRSQRVLEFKRAGFRTRAAVIVLADSSLFRRQRKQHQEEGKSVPETTIADMRANFSMPEVGDVFQEVLFVEAKPPEANNIAADQAEAAREALPKLRARAEGRQTRSKVAKVSTPPAKARKSAASKGQKAAASPVVGTPVRGKEQTTPDATAAADQPAAVGTPARGKEETTPDAADHRPDVGTPVQGKQDTMLDAIAAAADQPSEPATTNIPTTPTDAMVEDNQATVADQASASTDADAAPAAGAPSPVVEPVEAAAEATGADALATDVLRIAAEAEMPIADDLKGQDAGADQAQEEQAPDAAEQIIPTAGQLDAEDPDGILSMDTESAGAATPDKAQRVTEEAKPSVKEAADDIITADIPAAAASTSGTAPGTLSPIGKSQATTASDVQASPVAIKAEEPAEDAAVADRPVSDATQTAGQLGTQDSQDPAANDHSNGPAGPVKKEAEKANGLDRSARGTKRAAPAVSAAKGAKLARTSQAAGRLVGNIRTATTVKRTVFKGRPGVRQPGLRLPPPMQTNSVPVSDESGKAQPTIQADPGATNGAANGQEHAEKSTKGANLQEVMEHLLPVEEDKGKAEPAAGEAAASQQAKQDQANDAQPGPVAQQRDEGNKGAARSRQGDKRHQDRKPHDSSRPHQGDRNRSQTDAPHALQDRRGGRGPAPNSRLTSRDNRGNRTGPLGPRHAGVQKVHGRPLRNQHPVERNPRRSSGPGYDQSHPPMSRHGLGPRRASYPQNVPNRQVARGGPPAPPHRGAGPPAVLPRDLGPPPARHSMPGARLGPSRGPASARGAPPSRLAPHAPQASPVYAAPTYADPRSAISPEAHRPPPIVLPARRSGPPGPLRGPSQDAHRVAAPRSREAFIHTDRRSFHDRPAPNGAPQYSSPVLHAEQPTRRGGAPQRQVAGDMSMAHRRPVSNPRVSTPRGEAPGPRTHNRQQPSFPGGSRDGPSRGTAPLAGSPRVNPRQQQQPNSRYASPLGPPTQLPTPRLGPPVGTPRDNTPRAGRNTRDALQHDRPRSQSRGRQAPIVSVYPQDSRPHQGYNRSNLAPVVSPPGQYEPPVYAPEPHADPYGYAQAGRGPPQQSWRNESSQGMDYQQGPPLQQAYAGEGHDSYSSRRNDRQARSDRMPPVDASRFPGARNQGPVDQAYAPSNVYPPRDVSEPRRSTSHADQAPSGRALPHDIPPPQPQYSSPSPYTYSSGPEHQQPVYGSGPVAQQGYSAAPPPDSQPHYPPQQQQYAEAPQQYADAPQYSRQSYAAPAPQYAYDTASVAEAPGSYAPPVARGGPRRSEPSGYGAAYAGDTINRGQGYSEHPDQAAYAPVYEAPATVNGQPQGGWAPSPREPSYVSHNADVYGAGGRSQTGHVSGQAYDHGSHRQAPQGAYQMPQPAGQQRGGQLHAYGR